MTIPGRLSLLQQIQYNCLLNRSTRSPTLLTNGADRQLNKISDDPTQLVFPVQHNIETVREELTSGRDGTSPKSRTVQRKN